MINRSLLKGNLATPYPALKPCPSLITWRRPSCRQLITKSPLESIFSSPRWKLVIEHPSKNLLLSTKHYCSLRDITILLWTRFGVARGGGQHLCSLASEGFLFCSLAPGFLFLFLLFWLSFFSLFTSSALLCNALRHFVQWLLLLLYFTNHDGKLFIQDSIFLSAEFSQ